MPVETVREFVEEGAQRGGGLDDYITGGVGEGGGAVVKTGCSDEMSEMLDGVSEG